MTIEWDPSDLDDLINSYRSGQSAMSIAKRYGVSCKAITRIVRTLPDYRGADVKWEPPDLDDLVRRYRSGQSVKALAEHYGVSRQAVTRVVQDLPDYRGQASANRLMASQRTPEQRLAWVAAAQNARRGQIDRPETKRLRAVARQHRTQWVGSGEHQLIDWLAIRGVPAQAQLPVEGYNIDVAVPPVAVELITSTGNPLTRPRIKKRIEKLTNAGWHVLCVWLPRPDTLVEGAADQVVAFIETVKRDPSPIGQYRVIWGAAQDLIGCRDPNQMACIPSAIRTSNASS